MCGVALGYASGSRAAKNIEEEDLGCSLRSNPHHIEKTGDTEFVLVRDIRS
jgi:hypothetical protein